MQLCDFNNIEIYFARILNKLCEVRRYQTPFSILAISSSLEVQRKAAEIWSGKYIQSAPLYPYSLSGQDVKKYALDIFPQIFVESRGGSQYRGFD